jgi:hypothetical protein
VLTDLLFGLFQTVLTGFLALFPDGEAPAVFEHLGTIRANLGALNYFLPIAETVAIVVAVFALFPVFLGITLSLWVVAQLRGSSSIG